MQLEEGAKTGLHSYSQKDKFKVVKLTRKSY